MDDQKAPPPPYPGPVPSSSAIPQGYPPGQPQGSQTNTGYPAASYPMAYPSYQGYPPYGYQYYPPHSGPMYGTPGQTVYIVDDQRRNDSALGNCLTGCLTALCCCCMWDMLRTVG